MRILTIFASMILTVGAADAAQAPPQTSPVDAARITQGVLTLPVLQGSIAAPSPEWKWVASPAPHDGWEVYLCKSPDEATGVLVRIIPGRRNIKSAKVEFFQGETRELADYGGGSVLSETGHLVPLPPYDEVFQMNSMLSLNGMTIEYQRYLIPAGNHSVLLSSTIADQKDRERLRIMAASLKFAPPMSPDPQWWFYFAVGAVFLAVGIGINDHARRRRVYPGALALLGIMGALMVRICSPDSLPGYSYGHKIGYQIGLASLPLLIAFGLMIRDAVMAGRERRAVALQNSNAADSMSTMSVASSDATSSAIASPLQSPSSEKTDSTANQK